MAKNDDKSQVGEHEMILAILQVKKILSENKTKTNSVLVSNLNKVTSTSTALMLKKIQDLVFLCLIFPLPKYTG